MSEIPSNFDFRPAKEKARILVCYHKPWPLVGNEIVCPIEGGRATRDHPIADIIGDDTGDNISSKNPLYCELTALYWAWRNLSAEYLGLMHYRRIFDLTASYSRSDFRPNGSASLCELGLDAASIVDKVDNFDILLPRCINVRINRMGGSVWHQYASMHVERDLYELRAAVNKVAPATLTDFDVVFSSEETYLFNMIVLPWPLLDQYASWLFSILFYLELRIHAEQRDPYQRRALAFMAERLLSVYIHYWRRTEDPRICEVPIVAVSDQSLVD